MSTLTIVEGQGVGKQSSGDIQAMMLPYITIQRVTFTGTAGYSAKINSNANLVYLYVDANAAFSATPGSSGSVASTDFPLVSSTGMFFAVNPVGSTYINVVARS